MIVHVTYPEVSFDEFVDAVSSLSNEDYKRFRSMGFPLTLDLKFVPDVQQVRAIVLKQFFSTELSNILPQPSLHPIRIDYNCNNTFILDETGKMYINHFWNTDGKDIQLFEKSVKTFKIDNVALYVSEAWTRLFYEGYNILSFDHRPRVNIVMKNNCKKVFAGDKTIYDNGFLVYLPESEITRNYWYFKELGNNGFKTYFHSKKVAISEKRDGDILYCYYYRTRYLRVILSSGITVSFQNIHPLDATNFSIFALVEK